MVSFSSFNAGAAEDQTQEETHSLTDKLAHPWRQNVEHQAEADNHDDEDDYGGDHRRIRLADIYYRNREEQRDHKNSKREQVRFEGEAGAPFLFQRLATIAAVGEMPIRRIDVA